MPKAYILGTKSAKGAVLNGGGQRLKDITSLLAQLGFQIYCVDSVKEISQEGDSLLVLVSFPMAKWIRKVNSSSCFIWLDATDSWQLTRKTLFRWWKVSEYMKFMRDWLNSLSYGRANLVTYCSRRDLDYDRGSHQNRLVLNHIMNTKVPRISQFQRFVFVGDGSYLPNQEALQFLLDTYSKNELSIPLYVYGNGFKIKSKINNVNFCGLGYDLDVYASSDIHLVPIWSGAGVKYKTLNPLSYGIRVLSTIEGATGFNRHPLLTIVESKEEFCEKMTVISKQFGFEWIRQNLSEIQESDDKHRIIENLKSI